jgi:aminopeptidase N
MNKILVLLLLFAFACQPAADESSAEAEPANDPHSFARPQEAVTEHLSLSLRVDFEQRRLSGYARYRIRNQGADSIVLDTRNLAIERVTLGTEEEPATFRLGPEDELLGQPLIIDISPETEQLTIYYSTTEGADALDWLAPGQTAGKRSPFLFI